MGAGWRKKITWFYQALLCQPKVLGLKATGFNSSRLHLHGREYVFENKYLRATPPSVAGKSCTLPQNPHKHSHIHLPTVFPGPHSQFLFSSSSGPYPHIPDC